MKGTERMNIEKRLFESRVNRNPMNETVGNKKYEK